LSKYPPKNSKQEKSVPEFVRPFSDLVSKSASSKKPGFGLLEKEIAF